MKCVELFEDYNIGIDEDIHNKGKTAELVRLCSTKSSDEVTGLTEYVRRIKEGQNYICCINNASKKHVGDSILLEKLTIKGYEVLYVVDAIDECVVGQLKDNEGKKLVSDTKKGLELDESDDENKLEAKQRFSGFDLVVHHHHMYIVLIIDGCKGFDGGRWSRGCIFLILLSINGDCGGGRMSCSEELSLSIVLENVREKNMESEHEDEHEVWVPKEVVRKVKSRGGGGGTFNTARRRWAGIGSTPMDTIQTVMVAPRWEPFDGKIGTCGHMMQTGEFFSLYKGLVPSIISIAPSRDDLDGAYGILKLAFLHFPEGRKGLQHMQQQGNELHAFEQPERGTTIMTLVYGAIASSCSGGAMYPFQVMRWQLHMQVLDAKMGDLLVTPLVVFEARTFLRGNIYGSIAVGEMELG